MSTKNNEFDIIKLCDFISKLREGGIIVCSGECSILEIQKARISNRLYVDQDGFGYIYFPTNYIFEQ